MDCLDCTGEPSPAVSAPVAESPGPPGAALDGSALGDGARDANAKPSECPGAAGPTAIKVNGFCIDSTEVTNLQYGMFLAGMWGVTDGQPSACSWNKTYTPSSNWPPTVEQQNLPVTYVDWCDAYAYCRWAGKRLCGRIGGGPSSYTNYTDATSSQWYNACSGAGARTFPYGNSYDSQACVTGQSDAADARKPVGSTPGCVGGASDALFDMSGNVWEWEDACDGETGANDSCRLRGGGFQSGSSQANCAAEISANSRDWSDNDMGIRCCGP